MLDSYKQKSKKLQDALEKQQFESNLLKLQLQSLRNESVVQRDLLSFTEQKELRHQFSRLDELTLSQMATERVNQQANAAAEAQLKVLTDSNMELQKQLKECKKENEDIKKQLEVQQVVHQTEVESLKKKIRDLERKVFSQYMS